MHKERETEVCEILAQIIADRKTWGAVDDAVDKRERALALDDTAKEPFQYLMVY